MEYNFSYVIFAVDEIDKINFNEVIENSVDTLRYSIDGTLTFVKWNSLDVPICVQQLTTKSNYFSYAEILPILASNIWYNPGTIPNINYLEL